MVILTEAREQVSSTSSHRTSMRSRFEGLLAVPSPSVSAFSNEGAQITPDAGVNPSFRHGFRAPLHNWLLGITREYTLRNSEEHLPQVPAINNINVATPTPPALDGHSLHSQEHPSKLMQLDRGLRL
jgi:hypothetical protein